MGGLFLARGDQFWLPISVRGDRLAAKIGPGDHFFAKIGPGGPLFGGTDFGVTDNARSHTSLNVLRNVIYIRHQIA